MEKKICTKCGSEKLEGEFFWKEKKNQKRHTQCKECYKASRDNKGYYQRNKADYISRALARNKKLFIESRKKIREYLNTHPCIDCGIDNHIVLDFDHRDSAEKIMTVSAMVRNGRHWEIIETEIGKCDIRCANCHRIRTAKQFGYYAYLDE